MNTPPSDRWAPPTGPRYGYGQAQPSSNVAAVVWFIVGGMLGLAAAAAFLIANDDAGNPFADQSPNYVPAIVLGIAAAVTLIVGAIFAASRRG